MPILHRTTTLAALVPRYVSRFSCIGPQCEDNCCSGWQVALDKKTFKAYRQATEPQLAARFATQLTRHGKDSGKLEYGSIDLAPATRACPFMEERLCAVQKTLGESHLSHTCFSYPRMTRSFAGQPEQAMTLSCPEAARQALLAPDAFDFIEARIEARPDMVGRVVTKHGIALATMNEVRIFCLTLLRTAQLALWQRLAVLGVFCESLSTLLAEDRHAEVGALVQEFEALVGQGQALQALADMQPNHPAQALVFSTLWGGKEFVTHSAAQNQVIAAVAAGLGADESGRVSGEQLIEHYSRGGGGGAAAGRAPPPPPPAGAPPPPPPPPPPRAPFAGTLPAQRSVCQRVPVRVRGAVRELPATGGALRAAAPDAGRTMHGRHPARRRRAGAHGARHVPPLPARCRFCNARQPGAAGQRLERAGKNLRLPAVLIPPFRRRPGPAARPTLSTITPKQPGAAPATRRPASSLPEKIIFFALKIRFPLPFRRGQRLNFRASREIY
jgi:lysine-N-methylase